MFFLKALSQSRYFLSAMTGMLLTGSVFAGTAGRVNFISGEVTATSMDNATHTLYKGDLINAGDKLETSKNGRLQIRFTDGSILSLKPNSIFSVEKYSFSRDTPEQSNVVFNFVRGGFRTISGAIGKVNRMSYRMNTPVATIGIRGTDYSVNVKNEKVFVTVTDGKVHADNDAGTADINAGESYVIEANSAPSLCHIDESVQTKEGVKKSVIPQPCLPVVVPLEAEDGFYISKLKVKKPILESFKSYGDFAEALRRYNSLENEVNQSDNEVDLISHLNEKTTVIGQLDINRNNALNNSRLVGALDNKEMRDLSVINDFLQLAMPINVLDDLDAKDSIKPTQSNILSGENVVNVVNKGLEQKLDQVFYSLFASLISSSTTNNFFGNNTVIVGADFGSPDFDVRLGTHRSDLLTINLSPALRNKEELIGLGVLDSSLLAMDADKDNKLRGFSFRQGIMHDDDGIKSNKNSGSVIIGDGSAQQATVVFTDDNIPISVNLSLGDGAKLNVDNAPILDINVTTPKLAIKVGDIYVSNSNSSAENITKDGGIDLGALKVLGTNQDGGRPVGIMGASEIVLGAAKIAVKLKHHDDLVSRIVDGISVVPSISILADAFIKDGVTINHFEIKDAGGSLKGGSIKMNNLKISDYNSPNLTAKLAVNIEEYRENNNTGGVLLTLKQLGDSINGIDIAINDLSVGSDNAPNIGDIQMIGLNLNGANILLRGH